MTQNNYPEGLDELAQNVACDVSGPGVWEEDSPFPHKFSRALLDALAERGYVLVDAKKQEPVASLPFAILDEEMTDLLRFYECATDGEGYDVPRARMKRLAEIGLVRRVTASFYECTTFGLSVINGDFSERPTIPGRVSLPDGWKMVPVRQTNAMVSALLQKCANDERDILDNYRDMLAVAPTPQLQKQVGGNSFADAVESALNVRAAEIERAIRKDRNEQIDLASKGTGVIGSAVLDHIPQPVKMVPPTQPQGDGSLRRDAERYRWLRDLDVDDPRCEIGNYPGHMWNDAIDAAMEASNENHD